MDDEEINRLLKDHEKRLTTIESLMSRPRVAKATKAKKSLPDYILEIRADGFFSKPMTASETHKKLQENYYCEANRVAVALLRLANKKELRKATKTLSGKGHKAYVW